MRDEADSRDAGTRGSAEDGAQHREEPGGDSGLQQVADDEGHEALHQALLKRHVREGDHPRQAQDVHGEDGREGGRRHGEHAAVGAALGGQAGDRGDQEIAEDVAERGEGPADVRAGENRGARDAEQSVGGDGDEASAGTQGRAHGQRAERTERDGHGRERQRNRHAGEDDQGDRARGDERDLTNDRAAEAVGEDAVAARSCGGGDGQRGHAMPFDGANGLLFNS